MRRVHVGAALDYVFGYTVCNAPRATFSSESQWTRGKSFDTFCPLGPRRRDGGRAARVLFADLHAGAGRPPPDRYAVGLRLLHGSARALELGDVVECEVERIGVLRNAVAAAR
jgi:2-keto-4-pentenoate hydratase/2-oxohepta-3-ene-1,7-dioic acid hydratase in catechol pathway